MNTHFDSNLATISTADLHAVTGGSDGDNNVAKDWKDTQDQAGQTADAIQKKDWGNAGVHGVQTLADGAKTVGDVIGNFFGWGK